MKFRKRWFAAILTLCIMVGVPNDIFAGVSLEAEDRRGNIYSGESEWVRGETEIKILETEENTEESVLPAPPTLMSQAAVLMDGDTGRILYGKNEDAVLPMASTTKIMTCILALENASPEDVVKVSDYAASMPDVQLNIRSDETYLLKDLLYSLMLESHNDSAVAIAEHVAGSKEQFAALMNQKARDIGCTDTYFITPNGLDATDETTGNSHSTTAADLAKIMRYCISQSPKSEEFLEITRAPSHAFSNLERTRSFSCVNHNALLTTMDGALSGKTGFTNGAGYCYIGAVQKGEKTFIAALLACGWPPHKTYKWQDMRKLISYGNENYDYYEILGEEISLTRIPVENGIDESIGAEICYPKERSMKILMFPDEPVTIQKKLVKRLTAPVEEGCPAGQVDYYVGEDLIASYPIVTTEAVGLWDMEFCAKTLLNRLLFCYNPV